MRSQHIGRQRLQVDLSLVLGSLNSVADASIADSCGCLFAICKHMPSFCFVESFKFEVRYHGFGKHASPPLYDVGGFVAWQSFLGGVLFVISNPFLVREVCNNGMWAEIEVALWRIGSFDVNETFHIIRL